MGWLERAERERYGGVLAFLGVDPRFDPLRGEARFERLLRRLGFAEG